MVGMSLLAEYWLISSSKECVSHISPRAASRLGTGWSYHKRGVGRSITFETIPRPCLGLVLVSVCVCAILVLLTRD